MEELYREEETDTGDVTTANNVDQAQSQPDRTAGLRAYMDAVTDASTHDLRRLRMVQAMNDSINSSQSQSE